MTTAAVLPSDRRCIPLKAGSSDDGVHDAYNVLLPGVMQKRDGLKGGPTFFITMQKPLNLGKKPETVW